jgi:hypothetical protein
MRSRIAIGADLSGIVLATRMHCRPSPGSLSHVAKNKRFTDNWSIS